MIGRGWSADPGREHADMIRGSFRVGAYFCSGESITLDQRKDVNRYEKSIHQLLLQHIVQAVDIEQKDIL